MVWGALAAIILGIAAAFFLRPQPKALPIYSAMPDFALHDQDGRPASLADLRGKVWVADVIFTRCAGQCPIMSAHMKAIQDLLPASAPVRFVSFTTDPAFDTPPVLKKYAARYGADTRWSFLTGEKPALRSVLVDGLKLSAQEKPAADQADANDLFVHSAKFVLIDKQGRIRAWFDGETETAAARTALEAGRLAEEEP